MLRLRGSNKLSTFIHSTAQHHSAGGHSALGHNPFKDAALSLNQSSLSFSQSSLALNQSSLSATPSSLALNSPSITSHTQQKNAASSHSHARTLSLQASHPASYSTTPSCECLNTSACPHQKKKNVVAVSFGGEAYPSPSLAALQTQRQMLRVFMTQLTSVSKINSNQSHSSSPSYSFVSSVHPSVTSYSSPSSAPFTTASALSHRFVPSSPSLSSSTSLSGNVSSASPFLRFLTTLSSSSTSTPPTLSSAGVASAATSSQAASPFPVPSFSSAKSPSPPTVGLFGIAGLTTPDKFLTAAAEAIARCHALTRKVEESPPSLLTLRLLDDISDTLCKILDAAELCRSVHPSPQWRQAAEEAWQSMFEYMENLNTSPPLYQAIVRVTKDQQLMGSFTAEQKRVISSFQRELEQHGINLPSEARNKVNALQNEIQRLTSSFNRNINEGDNGYIQISPVSSLRFLPDNFRSRILVKENNVALVPVDQDVMEAILKWVSDESIRRQVYIAANSVAPQNLDVLEQLIKRRHDLASLLSFPSYAHLVAKDMLAKTPENVQNFLKLLSKQLRPKGNQELLQIEQEKNKRNRFKEQKDKVNGWDASFYMGLLKAREFNLDSDLIASYFPVDNCLKGLHIIISSLYNCSLVEVPISPDEYWAWGAENLSDFYIRKFEVWDDEKKQLLGRIYFDLYRRPAKFPGSAAFTLRCGKDLTERVDGTKAGGYQLPETVLVCNFPPPHQGLSLLNHTELEVLFHEVTNLGRSRKLFKAMETMTQVSQALFDQSLFGPQPIPGSTTQVLALTQNEHTLLPHIPGTHWHSKFGHLSQYGAAYFSYLFCRVFSGAIWNKCFAHDPLSRKMGQKYRDTVLRHGGAKDPKEMLTDLLGEDPTAAIQHFVNDLSP